MTNIRHTTSPPPKGEGEENKVQKRDLAGKMQKKWYNYFLSSLKCRKSRSPQKKKKKNPEEQKQTNY